MITFSIGLSALQTAEQGLAVAGNNLTNASTPGYHRQIADLTSLNPTSVGPLSIGTGVAITDINRAVSDQLDSTLTQQMSQNAFTDSQLGTGTQIQQALASGSTSPSTQLEGLLNTLQTLSATPTDGVARSTSVQSAQTVANAFNTAASDLSQIQQGLSQSIGSVVQQINPLIRQVADLNNKISAMINQGVNPNDLLDQRGQLVNKLAGLIGVQVQNTSNGQIAVTSNGVPLVMGVVPETLTVTTDAAGKSVVGVAGTDAKVTSTSGQLGGLLSDQDGQLNDFQNRLDTLARQVAVSFNAIQSTGLGTSGAFTQLTGLSGVSDITANLNNAGLDYPPQAGSLFIGVTNTATGQRTITEVPIDPQSQSIQDVANAIGVDVPNMQAFVNSQTGTMTLTSATGYTFDFTGGYEASPTTSFGGGSTTTPIVSGTYSGSSNDNYTMTFNSGGTVGVTPGLQADVTDSTGSVIATVNIGQGYQPGQPIAIAKGINISLGAGDVSAGDFLSTPVIANADTAGVLNALGLNTLFTGGSAAALRVNSNIVSDPGQLATSRTGQASDTSNLQRFAALGSTALLANGTQTYSQYANQMVADIGTSVHLMTQQQTTNGTLTTSITNQQQNVSGVDTNQELADVMKYQQLFEMAGKYIGVINDVYNSLITNV